MKYISLSFDDSRSDTFNVAMPIMTQYGLRATVNVISDFVLNPHEYDFATSPKAMTINQLLYWQNQWGGEVACHGSTHQNTPNDILKNISDMKKWGLDVSNIGFASPGSWLTDKNLESSGIGKLKTDGTISYLRSGIIVRREGFWYTLLSGIEMLTHSPWLFYKLNKNNIFSQKDVHISIFPSVAIKNYTTLKQVINMIEHMDNDDTLILMFHSILAKRSKKEQDNLKKDHWYWQDYKFKSLCEYLKNSKDIEVVLTRDLLNKHAR